MAHEVNAKLHTKVVGNKDIEVEIKTVNGESTTKLGTLLISKGNIEWLPRGASVNKRRLTWVQFAELLEREGAPAKTKKAATKKTKTTPQKS